MSQLYSDILLSLINPLVAEYHTHLVCVTEGIEWTGDSEAAGNGCREAIKRKTGAMRVSWIIESCYFFPTYVLRMRFLCSRDSSRLNLLRRNVSSGGETKLEVDDLLA